MNEMDEDISFFKSLTRKYIKETYDLKVSDVYGNKCTQITSDSGNKYFLKLFKSKYKNIQQEYDIQGKASEFSVAPKNIFISIEHMFFICEYVHINLIEYLNSKKSKKIPFPLQTQIYSLCARLDLAKIYHNNGNPMNLVMNKHERLYIIGYEMATESEMNDINMKKTLWQFARQFRHYRLRCEGLYLMYNEYIVDGINLKIIRNGDTCIPPRKDWDDCVPSVSSGQPPVVAPPRAIPRGARAPRPRGGPKGARAPRPRGGPRGARAPPRAIPRGARAPRPRGGPRGARGPRPRGGPRGARGPRGGPRGKKPPRTFRVGKLDNISKTVYEKDGEMKCCDFEDFTDRLVPKKKKTSQKKKEPSKKKKKYFQLNTGELAVLKKFVKNRKANSLNLLRNLDFGNLSLNRKTILSIFKKLYDQWKAMSVDKRTEMETDLPLSEESDLAIRLAEIPLLTERIAVLKFKELMRAEYNDIISSSRVVSNAADHIFSSGALKDVLQIIVQAINQRLKDFASKENVDFKQYKVLGIPAGQILVFMGQKRAIELIAEKVLLSNLKIDSFKIVALNEACNIHLAERIFNPVKMLDNEFKKMVAISKKLDISDYLKKTSSDIGTMKSIVDEMGNDLRRASQYLGESDSFMEITAGSNKYSILDLVYAILKKWNETCTGVRKRMVTPPKKDTGKIKELLERSTARRRSVVADSEDDWSN